MMCISPLRLKRKVIETDCFGREVEVDRFIDVPCGKCIACLSNRKNNWVFRLKKEFDKSFSASFLTLTYDDLHLPRNELGVNVLCKKHLQDFLKRLRINFERQGYNNKIRYFAVGEYGSQTLRPHYHLILFNYPREAYEATVLKSWSFGHPYFANVNDSVIAYVSKYVLAGCCIPELIQDFKDYNVPLPFMVCSKRPAIGSCYLTDDNIHYHTDNNTLFTYSNGHRIPLPRYYRDKIFSKETLEQLNYEIQDFQANRLSHKIADLDSKYGPSERARIIASETEDLIRKSKKQFKLRSKL